MLSYILKAQYEIWGLTAPIFAWCAAVVLLTVPCFAIFYLYRTIRTEVSVLTHTTKAIQRLRIRRADVPERGLSASAYKSLAQAIATQASLRAAWNSYNSLLVRLRSKSGEEEYWVTDSAETAFGEATLFANRINRSFFVAMPGIVTGTGLLFTFLAILVALLDVRIDTNSQVQGLGLLIGGLSGKFVSSVAALFGATLFLLAEKPLFHSLTKARLLLVRTIDESMPRLTSVGILAELQQGVSRLTGQFESFNADLTQKLKRSYGESFIPDVHRTAEFSERLAELLSKVELRNRENVTESLRAMFTDMQRSISSSLQEMGSSFKEGMLGAAKEEFGTISKSLVDSAQHLDNMSAQFQTAQSAFNDMLEMVQSSTAEQLALGKQQVEDLNAVLRQFMAQMNESAGTSVNQIADTLKDVLQNLSAQVGELERKMAASMEQNVEKSTSAVSGVMKQAETWFARSTTQLDRIMRQSESQAKHMKDVESTLRSVMKQSMAQMNESTGASMNQIASTLTGILQGLTSHVDDLEQKMAASMQQNVEKAASTANTVMQQAGTWSAQSAEQLGQIMKQYESQTMQMKDAVESTLGSVLGTINTSLEQHAAMNADWRQITSDVSDMVAASTDATRTIQQAQESIEQVAKQTTLQLEQASSAQKEIWTWIHNKIVEYQDIFGITENRARNVLAKMEQNLGSYIDSNREGYERLIIEADGHLKAATQRLGASVQDLSLFLQNLTETFRKAQRSHYERRP